MARNWTRAQRAAMSATGRTLLISAAAGSGKTATLTERIIRRITDPEHPADLSRMLIVTFTRAAAAELRERISGALSDAIAKDPGNRYLQKQLINMGSAHISTIDAFCREPVKAHFAELGLPAVTRIADAAELAPLSERVMGELMDEFFHRYRGGSPEGGLFSLLEGNPFSDLCDALTPFKNDTELIPILLELYEKLLCFPAELDRLREDAISLRRAAEGDFFDAAPGRMIAEWTEDFARSGVATMETCMEIISETDSALKGYGPAFENDLSFCRRLTGVKTYREAYTLLHEYTNIRLGRVINPSPLVVAAKEERTALYKSIHSLRDTYYRDTPEEITAQMLRTAEFCDLLHSLLTEYDRRILEEKKNRGICDFTDNRRYLLRLLREPDGSPSPIAQEFRRAYDEVYVDEYQDVDEMQDEIFRLIGDDHRFMVGDIKQSIYVFRGADPSVFARYRRELTPMDTDSDEPEPPAEGGNSIFMSENFRCDESVIRVANAVCGHAFRACPETIGYRPQDDLGFSKLSPEEGYVSPKVCVAVMTPPPKDKGDAEGEPAADAPKEGSADGDELTGVDFEANYVAGEIARLLKSRTPLANGQPVRPSDIVILMRSRTALSAYMRALTAMGIPTGSEELEAAEAGRDILHGGDMSYLVNLLRAVDNPSDDIPLSEVLRAPFPGLDLQELVTVRAMGDTDASSHTLLHSLREYADTPDGDPTLRDKLTAFLAWLDRYRRLTETQTADGILRLLRRDPNCACRDTDAFFYLYECARTCRTSSFLSLSAFLRYFERKLKTEKRVSLPKDETDGGCVSIMSIHNSKGLEFPVCFVVRCGQYFRHKTQSADLIFDRKTGAAMKLYNRTVENGRSVGRKTDTTLRAAAALSVKLTEREEEMRLLYVAMTRARERLYLVGMDNLKPCSFQAGDRFATLSANSYLKWIRAGLEAHPEAEPFYRMEYVSDSRPLPEDRLDAVRGVAADPAEAEAARYYREILQTRPAESAAEGYLRRVPAKIPASRMRPGLLDDCVFFETDVASEEPKPTEQSSDGSWCDPQSIESIRRTLALMTTAQNNEFDLLLAKNRRPTAAERGTAIHLFLQFCDYGRVLREGVEADVARLTEEGFINSRTAGILDRRLLEGFFASEFFAHLGTAVRVERELRFARFVPLASLTANPALAEAAGDRTVYVQGSIDLLAEYPDGHLELCDYKTDRLTPEEREDPSLYRARVADTHRHQLSEYAAAIRELYGKRPTKAYVFSLSLGEAVEVEV